MRELTELEKVAIRARAAVVRPGLATAPPPDPTTLANAIKLARTFGAELNFIQGAENVAETRANRRLLLDAVDELVR